MSDYISGQEIVDEYEILPFEFLERFIYRGLLPLAPQSGQPVEVVQFLAAVLNIQEMAANDAQKKEHYKNFIDANNETNWPELQPSNDEEINAKINKGLLSHIYDRKLYDQLVALDLEIRHGKPKPEPLIAAPKKPSNRPSRDHEEKCREVAQVIWGKYPTMHPSQLIDYTVFINCSYKKNGKQYSEGQLRDWIRDLWPEPPNPDKKGRPVIINVSEEDINKLFPE
jgi:hypothetical protein